MKAAQLYTDGGARGNPGPAGAGAWLENSSNGKKIDALALFLGDQTNNYAEYTALVEGLRMALRHKITELHVMMDSQLIVEQMQGNYKVRNAGLKPLHEQANALLPQFHHVTFTHIPREKNTEADRLVNKAIDQGEIEKKPVVMK